MEKSIMITIDLEDWFQVENFKAQIPFSQWHQKEYRFENSTNILLDLFEFFNIKVTFFVLAWNAERKPNLIKKISQSGHEIASHGYAHDLCSNLDRIKILSDLEKSKIILEDIIGKSVIGYRAPSFSISDHVIDMLKKLTFKYDSSFNSFSLNRRYGTLDFTLYYKKNGYYVDRDNFAEIPISNLKIAGKILPWGGGGYFRLYPACLFRWGVNAFLNRENCYIFYLHPWEIDFAQPVVKTSNWLSTFRHYHHQNRCLHKLDAFFDSFKGYNFLTCADYLNVSS